jgi:hypothetical protein
MGMEEILKRQVALTHHPVYDSLNTIPGIRNFMQHHVFAVWDFMSLLKSLQRRITCVEVPWRPSVYPAEMVRLINQIVVGEESDTDYQGAATSHFELYLKAMTEVGASTAEITDFITTLDLTKIPAGVREFVTHNLEVAQGGHIVEVAASFFFGREKLIPPMFQTMVDTLKSHHMQAPTLIYYLERHIEVDGQEHGPLAMRCLEHLTGQDPQLQKLAATAGLQALQMRQQLWNTTLKNLKA